MMEKGFEDFGFGKSRWAAAGGDDGGVEVVVELAEEGDEADVVDLEKPATQFRIVGPETAAYSGSVSDVTRILEAAGRGDPKAANELLPLVYDELRRLAAAKMAHERPDQTLQPTALVHEAWLRLTGNAKSEWNGRVHFFGAAAEAMRRILIENARRKSAARHGGGQLKVDIADLEIAAAAKDDELLAVSDALERFAARDGQKAELVKLRYFVGLTTEEAAELLGISVPTADRWWNFSRAWLFEEIERQRKE